MPIPMNDAPLTLPFLSRAYGDSELSPASLVEEIWRRIERDRERASGVWLYVETRDRVAAQLARLEERRLAGELMPLYGVPFAVKDNIDVAGAPTTAGCTAFARAASSSASVVARLMFAGAIFVGKVNLDQLATGLVGVRTPYGIPRNAFDERTIPGGSSSGSALAVARGHVSFALGTDTAGSGRVPAAFNNLVGLKPTRGLISTTGVVPACRSLDCVSIFALTVADACAVAEAAKGFDAFDPFSREDAGVVSFLPGAAPSSFRFGVPSERDLVFFDDEQARRNFHDAVERLERLGGERVAIDFAPFREAAALLYEGPWAAERLVAGKKILDENPEALHPVVRDILSDATRIDGLAAFRGTYRLRELARTTSRAWAAMDVLVVPTAPTIYSIADVESDPRRKNAHLGTYTNFVNLLDLSALAVPAGFRADGLPSGITLIGPRDHDHRLAAIGDAFHRSQSLPLGATGARDETAASPSPRNEAPSSPAALSLAVVGAHLRGLPLHHELLELGATFVRACRTVPAYRLFALPSATPPKPALVRVSIGETGHAIEVEVWSIPSANFGAFIAKVRAPLCIGTLALEDGTSVHGFLCEASATTNAEDISAHGGWRAYLASLKACSNPPLSV